MDILQHLNRAVQYVEGNLCGEPDGAKAARIACAGPDGFKRIFAYLTGVTLTGYIRRRRLTEAAYELQRGTGTVLALAVKYGYSSQDSFSRAFLRQHGILPTQARLTGAPLRVYPPISFHLFVKGTMPMNVRIIESPALALRGICKPFTGAAGDRWEQEHLMWADHHDAIPWKISATVGGVWYAVWDRGNYTIARRPVDALPPGSGGTYDFRMSAGRYAVFETERGGFAGDLLPPLRERIFTEWLPSSGFEAAGDYEVEVYHIAPRSEPDKRWCEIWVPLCP